MSKLTASVSPSFNARAKQNNATRPPSFPSESSGAVVATAAITALRRPKTREVASRYLDTSSFSSSSSFLQLPSSTSSPSSAKRCITPIVTRTNRPQTPSATNRPQSTAQRQSVTPRRDSLDRRGSGEVSTAQRMLLASGRGLFASFQAESKQNSSSPSTAGKRTLEKRKTTSTATPRSVGARQEKSKLSEQWPRSLQPSCLRRSLDLTDTRKKSNGSRSGVVGTLQNSMISNRRVSVTDSSCSDIEKVDSSKVGSHSIILDTDSVSCGSSHGRGNKLLARGTVVKERFSQFTSNRSQHPLEPGSPVTLESPKLIVVPKKPCVDSPTLSPKGNATHRSHLFPKREQARPASPSTFRASSSPRGTIIARGVSPSRGVIPPRGVSPSGRISPSRVRSSLSNSLSSIANFAVDAKKERVRENVFADAHLLRLFHNTLMQWRFANARTNAVISAQQIRVERSLYNAWISISKLYDSVRAKRIEMQHLKQNLKLFSILSRQMLLLEEWIVVDQDCMGSLVGAAEALKGSTLCLPVDCGAVVNVQYVKDAICSAVDIMQAMASSICLLLPKVGKISCLAAELGRVNVKEQGMLEMCRDLLNTISTLQVTERSLRTHSLQQQYSSPRLSNIPKCK